jgi:cytochrome c oxidase subunit 1
MDHEHEHHHKRHFITKYIFSLDHKMIANNIDNRYYGYHWCWYVGWMQLALARESFKIFNILLGDNFNGVMANDIYLALVTIFTEP